MDRSRRQGLGIWLLFYQIFGVIGLNNIPPATLLITALQVLIFLRIIPVPWYRASDVCISVDSVWHRKQWIRLFYGALEHGSDWHLYYNMISFVWKGISLERKFGSARFAYLVSIFTALCSATLVGLCQLAGEYGGRQYYHQCAVGFSGVLFALKVLTTHYWPHGTQHVMGMPFDLPVRYLVWIELLLIQILVPNASFLGHLAGVLVGLAYIHTPVGHVIDSGWNILKSVAFSGPVSNRFRSTNRLGGGYYQGRYYPEGMTEEEQYEFARQESLRSEYNRNRQYSAPNYAYSRPSASNNTYSRPSAPYPDHNVPPRTSSNLPYPDHKIPPRTSSNLPYPETDYISPTPGPSLYPNLDEIRRQRLSQFQ